MQINPKQVGPGNAINGLDFNSTGKKMAPHMAPAISSEQPDHPDTVPHGQNRIKRGTRKNKNRSRGRNRKKRYRNRHRKHIHYAHITRQSLRHARGIELSQNLAREEKRARIITVKPLPKIPKFLEAKNAYVPAKDQLPKADTSTIYDKGSDGLDLQK